VPARPPVQAAATSDRVKAFELPEFRALFHEQRDPLFRFLLRLTRDPADAEDLLQETFLTVWKKRELYEGRGSAVGFLRRTAYRLFLNAHDRRAPACSALAAAQVPADELAAPDDGARAARERQETIDFLVRQVRAALEELPEPTRTAFVLFRYEGLTCAEVAETQGAPQKTVETRIARATELLAQRLRAYRDHAHHL
jgi:RNA polymerase sigma-70 factor (ECF subfamily)